MPIPEELLRTFKRQGYQLAGRHSAVKTCHWTRQSLLTSERRVCYKQKFYGIRSLRCMQMTPTLGRCTQNCLFCWRAGALDLGLTWNQALFPPEEADEPEVVVEECLKAHWRALIGFKGNPKVDLELLNLALNPVHVAISLEGEVTLYPMIGELIEEFFRRGFKTVFLVTNGTLPEVLEKLSREPTQLYVSLCAPDEETYIRVCRPAIKDGWERVNRTLELLESFSCPTVVRHTLVRGLNMRNVEEYAKLDLKANPTYIEPKAAMAVGFFLKRLPREAMPTHEDVVEFSKKLSELTGYDIIDESRDSRVTLLSRLEKPIKWGMS